MNTATTTLDASVLDAARDLYQGEDLNLPSMPDELAARLRRVDATAYASRDLDWTLYDFEYFLNELHTGQAITPYVAFGLAGHGLISQAAHYYAVTPHCAVLFQMRWGTPLDQPEQNRTRYNAALAIAHRLQTTAAGLAGTGSLPENRRLVVADSSFHGSRWAWLPTEATPGDKPDWHFCRDSALLEGLVALTRLG